MFNQSYRWMKRRLKKFFLSLFSEKKTSKYAAPIIDAASNKGYVESYSNKADSLHLDLKKLYEEDLQENFLKIMKKLSPHFRGDKSSLAIDIQEEGFYGKTNSLYIVGTSYKGKSYPKAFKFITISKLTGKKEERVPLFALPFHLGQDVAESVEILISAVRLWLNKIDVVQFDRGFHNKQLVKFLEDNKVPYLIHARKFKGYLADLVDSTEEFCKREHKLMINVNKTKLFTKTKIYVCKNIEKKNWIFFSSLNFKNKWAVRNKYRNRWQIETNYSVHNSARIMSRSTDYMIRYFYYLVDTLLQVLWRICLNRIPFRTILHTISVGIGVMLKKKPHLAGT